MMTTRPWPSKPRLPGMRLAAASGRVLETLQRQLVEFHGETIAHHTTAQLNFKSKKKPSLD
jgi:hypothetical protein